MLTATRLESDFGSRLQGKSNDITTVLRNCQPRADYSKESNRLASYVNWPNKEIDPIKLAGAGFYFTGTKDIVRCDFCGVQGFEWTRADKPMEDHKSWEPNCTFVRRVQRTESNEEPSTSVGQDTCGRDCIEIFPKSIADDELLDLEKLGANKTKGPKHKDYITPESRLKSFASWPKSMKQKPADLAEAGFYYRGTGDQTLCFHCGGGLNDWEENDDPWEQHATWFSKCNYLLMKKGKSFVDKVQEKLKEPTLPQEVPTTSSSSQEAKELEKSECSASPTESQASQDDREKSTAECRLCKICYKQEMGVLFLPCGHIVACVDCATALTHCAVCRQKVSATVRAFIS